MNERNGQRRDRRARSAIQSCSIDWDGRPGKRGRRRLCGCDVVERRTERRRNTLRRTCVMLVWMATSAQVAVQQLRTPAEPELSIGFTVPVTWNDDVEIVRGNRTAVAAVSGDVSVAGSGSMSPSNCPR
jgi:hypothetical protein